MLFREPDGNLINLFMLLWLISPIKLPTSSFRQKREEKDPKKDQEKEMLANKKGWIVATSSGVSQRPPFGASAHSAAKSALNAFMKSLALKLGPADIRVNMIAPGLTMTDNTAQLPEQVRRNGGWHDSAKTRCSCEQQAHLS